MQKVEPELFTRLIVRLLPLWVFCVLLCTFDSIAQVAPANDNFTNAQTLLGPSGYFQENNAGAMAEPGEPGHAGIAASSSVWFAWTAPANGWVDLNTAGSVDLNGDPLATRLAIYTGWSISNLTGVVSNVSDPAGSGSSRVGFNATLGTVYYVAVDAAPGVLAFHWGPALNAGTFSFAQSTVNAGAGDWIGPRDNNLALHAMIPHLTVTRTGGYTGRVLIDYTIVDSGLVFDSGTVAFDDFDMAENIYFPPPLYATYYSRLGEWYISYLDEGVDVEQMVVQLSNPRLDPLESLDRSLNTVTSVLTTNIITSYDYVATNMMITNIVSSGDTNGPGTNVIVTLPTVVTVPYYVTNVTTTTITNIATDIVPPSLDGTNTEGVLWVGSLDHSLILDELGVLATNDVCIANFEVAEYRAYESIGLAHVKVTLNEPAPKDVTIHYRIDYDFGNNSENWHHFQLLPGDDYATPSFLTTNGCDFTNVVGDLHWGQGYWDTKTIDIPIVKDYNVEFNEDMILQLYKLDSETLDGDPIYPGFLRNSILTIIFDDQPAGSVDRNYNPDWSYGSYATMDPSPGANGVVNSIAMQPDGKMIIGGAFTSVDTKPVNRIARVDINGFPDSSFVQFSPDHSGADDAVLAVAVDAIGNSIVAGKFLSIDGQKRYHIARLRPDGSLDSNFDPQLGANGSIRALAVQPDGKIVIGGEFTTYNTTNRNRIARLNTDGSLDSTFDPGSGVDANVLAIALQSDGAILIGGEFTQVNGQNRSRLARLGTNGVLDAVFNNGTGPDNIVRALVAVPGGKVLLGGDFATVTRKDFRGLARLNADGSVDTSFTIGTGVDGPVKALALQPDGSILVGGNFNSINQTRRVSIARLTADGVVDTTFMDTAYNQYAGLINRFHNPSAVYLDTTLNGIVFNYQRYISSIAVDPNGGVLVGGDFLRIGGGFARDDYRYRNCYARLIGGQTPGPGTVSLPEDTISANKGSRRYVTLIRNGGNLGPATVTVTTNTPPPGPGAATANDFSMNRNYARPYWNLDYDQSWMVSVGEYGTNFNTVPHMNGNANVYIDIFDNNVIDGTKKAGITLINPSSRDLLFLGGQNIPTEPSLGLASAQLEIIDKNYNAGVFGFASTNFIASEGGVTATVTVIRTNGSTGQSSVDFSTVNGTAKAGIDYVKTNGTLFFSDGEVQKSLVIPVNNNNIQQADRSFVVRLSNPTGTASLDPSIAPTNTFVTIVDDDFLPGHLTFDLGNFVVNETDGTATIKVDRLGGSMGVISVQCLTSDGSAVGNLNYTPVSKQLTWSDRDVTSKTFTVPIIRDYLYTSNLVFNLTMTNAIVDNDPKNYANPYVLGFSDQSNAVVTIVNQDFPGVLSFSSPNYTVMEDAGSVTVTVVRHGGVAGTISASFAPLNGTATNGLQFTGSNARLTFAPGETAKTVTLGIINEYPPVQHPDRTINLILNNPSPDGVLGTSAMATATVTIMNTAAYHEPAGAVDPTFLVGDGFNNFVYDLTLQPDGKLLAGGDFTVFNRAERDRVARINNDGSMDSLFQEDMPGANGTVRAVWSRTPDSGNTNGPVVIGGSFSRVNTVARNSIARLYQDGSLDQLFNPGSGCDAAVYAIAEPYLNTNLTVLIGGAFTRYDGMVRNGIARVLNDGTLDQTFDPGLGVGGGAATVYTLAVQPDNGILIGGDFTSVGGLSRNGVARLNPDGSVDPAFVVDVGTNGTVRAIVVQPDGKIVIGGTFTNVNGSALNRIARLNADGSVDVSFTPGKGFNDSVLALALDTQGRIFAAGEFNRDDGVTRNRISRLNSDGSVDPGINFGEGADGAISSLVVQPDGRVVMSGGFTRFGGISAMHIARIFGGAIAGSGTVAFNSATYSTNESAGYVSVTLVRQGGTFGASTVTLMTTNGTAISGIDYIGVTTNVTFVQGETFQSVNIPVINTFKVQDNKWFGVLLTNLPTETSSSLQPTAEVTIINDNTAVCFGSTSYQYKENTSGGMALIDVIRLGNTNMAFTVQLVTTGGTAIPTVNYVPSTNTVVFPPGLLTNTVSISVIDDGIARGSTTVNLVLTNSSSVIIGDPGVATLTILEADKNPGTILFSQPTYTANEAEGLAVLTLIRTNGSTGAVSVDYATADGSAIQGVRYVATNGTISFDEGETVKTIAVPLINDPVVRGDQNFTVNLSNPKGGVVIAVASTASVTVLDNNAGVGFTSPYYFVDELGGNVVIGVTRIGRANGPLTVNYTTLNGTAKAGTNYTSLTNQVLRFADGEVLKNISVPILHDYRVAGNLNFAVSLANPVASGAVQLGTSNAVVVILDGDSGYSFLTNSYSVSKAGTNAVITVLRIGSTSGTGGVYFATSDGTAVSGTKYVGTSGFLPFAQNQATNTFLVPIINNTRVDGDQTVNLSLFDPTNGDLVDPATAILTIVDNNIALSFSSSTYSVSERGVSKTISVVRTGLTNSTVSADFATADGTASAGKNYYATNATLTFGPGVVSNSFTVRVIDDGQILGDKSVKLALSNPTGGAQIQSPSASTLWVTEADGTLVVAAGMALTSESVLNGIIDPNETVTVSFGLRSLAGTSGALTATLLSTNGVSAISGPQNYGSLSTGGHAVARPFTFTISGANGQVVTAYLQIKDGTNVYPELVPFVFTLGKTVQTYASHSAITINDNTPATPYPAPITVSGASGSASSVTVTLQGFGHTYPRDVSALLAGPGGQTVLLFSHCGGTNAVSGLNLTFGDAMSSCLSYSNRITSGSYKPSTYNALYQFPSPAPGRPYGTNLSVFDGLDPNGQWSLYLMDDHLSDVGVVSNGWMLSFGTGVAVAPSADLETTVVVPSTNAVAGNQLTYTVAVTNYGPGAATGITLSDILPQGATYVGGTLAPVSNTNGVLTFALADMPMPVLAGSDYQFSGTSFDIVITPGVAGTATNVITADAVENDANPTNNIVSTEIAVRAASADLAISLVDAPNPLMVGAYLTYTATVTNAGPSKASSVILTDILPDGVGVVSAPQGWSLVNGALTVNLGDMDPNTSILVPIVVRVSLPGIISDTVRVASSMVDPSKANNFATVKTEVDGGPAVALDRGTNGLLMRWPVNDNFVVETTDSLTPPVTWVEVTNMVPVLVNGEYQLPLPVGDSCKFYRLKSKTQAP